MAPPTGVDSPEGITPFLVRNWNRLTMTEITTACAWGLDPGFARHDTIAEFMLSLPRISNEQLPPEQDCHVCFLPFPEHASDDIAAVRLRCGHIVGADCLYEWLESCDKCPHCHTRVFFRPAAGTQQQISNVRHFQIMRGLRQSGLEFLAVVPTGSGSGSVGVEGFHAFRRWAFGNEGGKGSLVARIHARAHIWRFESYVSAVNASAINLSGDPKSS